MSTPVRMPQLGESVVEGTVARWLKQEGEPVSAREPLLEISTDKIDTEVPAPDSGVLLQILVPDGQTVAAGTVLAHIGAAGEAVPDGAQPVAEPAEEPPPKPSGRDFVSPVVARIAAQHQIDVQQVPGTGLGGRVTRKDILAFVESGRTAAKSVPAAPPEPAQMPPPDADLSADEVLRPLSAMRRAIAGHMARSKQSSPHVTTVFEADMTAVVRHREANREAYAQTGVRLTFTPYFVAAAAAALRIVPEANSRFGDAGLVLNRRIHVGIAVAVEDGLLVPVIRDADERSLQGLARAVDELAARARSRRLTPDELQGGTFTITNHGVGGSLLGTPIIHQPQAGILGVGAIVKRPVVRSSGNSLLPSADDAIVIRPMCYLSFSFDHRVLDGARADAFVAAVKAGLESGQM